MQKTRVMLDFLLVKSANLKILLTSRCRLEVLMSLWLTSSLALIAKTNSNVDYFYYDLYVTKLDNIFANLIRILS